MPPKLLGGILLVIGTSIGGGVLALPISAAPGGFLYSSLLLLGCWVVMTLSAFLILEVNLWLPTNSNLISMAKATLGNGGAAIAWVTYLLLFYCLLAVYLSGGSDMLHQAFSLTGLSWPVWLSMLVYIAVLGGVVYQGTRSVDYLNRIFMFTKFIAYGLLVIFIASYVDSAMLWKSGKPKYLIASITIMITSFGFASIVPSLRSYFQGDVKKLRLAILIGSLVPLVFYIVWNLLILGVVPHEGEHGLVPMLTSGHSTTDLPTALSHYLNNNWITVCARIFAALAVATSFLGVALGTSDFLADGFKIAKKGKGKWLVYTLTFIPPLTLALFYHNVFIAGLSYAGICCVILLALYPALMAWRGRYTKKLAANAEYQLFGGKSLLIFIILVSLLLLGVGLFHDLLGFSIIH